MADYVLSCCSAADLNYDYMKERNVVFAKFHVMLDGEVREDDMGKSLDMNGFYEAMADDADTKTSQVNVDDFTEHFENILKEGKDIIHISLSSGLSGAINSANIAREDLLEKYPDRKIIVIDSLGACGGYGMLVDTLADLRDEGKSIEELAEYAMNHRLNIHHWFFTTDLKYLIRGGRVSKTSGFVGGILNICPLLNMDYEGKLMPRFKIRTKKKVIQAIIDQMVLHADDGLDYKGKCFINDAYDNETAHELGKAIEERFSNLKGKIFYNSIGATIGSHTGPGTVGLFFFGDARVD